MNWTLLILVLIRHNPKTIKGGGVDLKLSEQAHLFVNKKKQKNFDSKCDLTLSWSSLQFGISF